MRETTNTKRYKYWHVTILHVHRKDWNYATDDVNGPFHGVQSNWRIFPPTSGRARKKSNEATIPLRDGGWQVRIKQRRTQQKHAWQVTKMKVVLWELAFCLSRFVPKKLSFPWFQCYENFVNGWCKHVNKWKYSTVILVNDNNGNSDFFVLFSSLATALPMGWISKKMVITVATWQQLKVLLYKWTSKINPKSEDVPMFSEEEKTFHLWWITAQYLTISTNEIAQFCLTLRHTRDLLVKYSLLYDRK